VWNEDRVTPIGIQLAVACNALLDPFEAATADEV
jgi:hypothetical protein